MSTQQYSPRDDLQGGGEHQSAPTRLQFGEYLLLKYIPQGLLRLPSPSTGLMERNNLGSRHRQRMVVFIPETLKPLHNGRKRRISGAAASASAPTQHLYTHACAVYCVPGIRFPFPEFIYTYLSKDLLTSPSYRSSIAGSTFFLGCPA